MSEQNSSVAFHCGDSTNGHINLCGKSLFTKFIHEISGNGDELIALCNDGCYNINTSKVINNLSFKVKSFCSGKNTNYILSTVSSEIYSWGEGQYGELGLGVCKTKVSMPTVVKCAATFSSISCGEYHCTATDNIGIIYLILVLVLVFIVVAVYLSYHRRLLFLCPQYSLSLSFY